MTYPQYQQQPGYPAQPYAPQGYQQQPVYAPAPTPQGAAPLGAPTPSLGQTRGAGGNVSPKARHLVGRTIIIEPIRVDENAKDDAGKARPEAYFHLTVCDGGPLEFGDSQDNDPAKQHGMTQRIDTPCRFTNVNDYGFGFVNECRDALARGDLAAVGVFERGTQGNRPYLLTKPGRQLDGKDRPDGDARFELASRIWDDVFNKRFQSPAPVSLVAPPQQAPAQVTYQPTAPAPQQQYAQQGYSQQPAYNPQQYAAPMPQPAYAQMYAEQTAPGFQTPYAAANPGTGPYGDGPVSAAPQQQYAPPQDPAYLAWLAQQQGQQGAPQGGPGI